MHVELVEVAPRDGLQNESVLVGTDRKLELINRLIAAGVRRLEVTSFVSPRLVPQLADADELVRRLPESPNVRRIGLVLNARGAERAVAAGVEELGAVCAATDRFGMANQGRVAWSTVDDARKILAIAHDAGQRAQVTIAVAFGCPFEGEVAQDKVVAMAERLADSGPIEIALADTIGVAVPSAAASLVKKVAEAVAPLPVRVHFHDTRGTGVANVWAAVEAGARIVDASLGGLGGCPFAPGAAGNVATEDVIYMLHRSGFATGIDEEALNDASRWLAGMLGRRLPGRSSRARPFPPTDIGGADATASEAA